MSWRSQRTSRPSHERSNDSFLPREWDEYFGGLTPVARRAASAQQCGGALAVVSLDGEVLEQALRALLGGRPDSDLLAAVRAIVERYEGEYDSVVGGDESKLACDDPGVANVFARARGVTALHLALQGDLAGMAYEAWFVLNELNEVRRLVGMPPRIAQSA